jgi:hypothetical protein
MNLSMHYKALLRGILAGAVVLSGASACSRSDRAGAGRDTTESGATAVTPSDSQTGASAPQPTAVSGYRGMEQDTVPPDSASPEPSATGAASPLDPAGITSDYALTVDTTAAGYSEMARDSSSAAGRGDTAAVAVADTTTPDSTTVQAPPH